MWRVTHGSSMLNISAATSSLVAALIHAWVMPEHFEEWWGYGAFFLASTVAQGVLPLVLVRQPRPWHLLAGIAGNLAIIALYVVTRTRGIPLAGPRMGEVEGVGPLDLAATAVEAGLILMLVVMLVKLWRTSVLSLPKSTVAGHSTE